MAEVDLRDLPPVEPLEIEEARRRRFSMTLLRYANRCNRSAYLYLKHRGGAPSHALNRGSVAHAAFERMLVTMRDEGESQLPMDVAKDIMAEEIARAPVTVPSEEQASMRVMAAHVAEGVELDPASIVGIEQKVILPIEEFTVVGKLDVVIRAKTHLEIWDWKTALAMSQMDEIAEKLRDGRLAPKSFQLLVYVLLAAFGIPVETRTCEGCGGTGTVYWVQTSPDARPLRADPGDLIHVKGDPREQVSMDECDHCGGVGKWDAPIDDALGHGLDWFQAFEMYPMFLRDDGIGRRGPLTVSRPELIDHRLMLEGLVFKLGAMLGEIAVPGVDPWRFEAVSGTHCQECPARAECPLPERLRHWAGEVNDREQAEEAATRLHDFDKPRHAARAKELRTWMARHGSVRVGADRVLELVSGTRKTTDSDGLVAAAERAAQFGEPLDVDAYVRESQSTNVKLRKLEPGEFAPAEEETADVERFGDVPF